MQPARRPDAEVDVDVDLVRRLLAEQHTDLAERDLVLEDAGFDNVLVRLVGSGVEADLAARLPRRAAAAELVRNEQRWLPHLASRLPLPVPAPVRTGRPGQGYPWPWSVVPWLDGVTADEAPLRQPGADAVVLAAFLRRLHTPASADAPHNPYRGVPFHVRADELRARLADLHAPDFLSGVAHDVLRRIVDAATGVSSHDGPSVWVHGDLHPANVLVHRGRVRSVLDFGDLCAGDPATDLAVMWMLFDVDHHARFWRAYLGGRHLPVADALQRRARGWAVFFGTMLLEVARNGDVRHERVARATLQRLVDADG